MTKTDLDWSFDYIPAEDEGGLPARVPVAPAEPPARPAPRAWRRLRWLLLALPPLFLLGALGAYVFQRVGWQRLSAQVTHEVVTEDAYARAGDVVMVRAFLAPDDQQWSALRAAEARHGLAVTLPAGHLRPLDQPPVVESVEVLEGQVFQAAVLRAFTDPAGQTYHFRYHQRYRSLGPGLWERLPTDPAALALQGRWSGERLTAIFPMTDWPWLQAVLPRLDAWLVQACADWDCPARLEVPLTFTGQPDDLRPPRGADAWQPGPLTTPAVFGLSTQRPRHPARLLLPALLVAGTPADEAASEALVRGLGAHALLYAAQQVSGMTQDAPDFYLEALVARAETRLGLSPALSYNPVPDGYVPPPGLWSRSLGGRRVDLPLELTYRLQALAFLNFALEGQPAQTDGALLQGLRRQRSLVPWLAAELGSQAARLPAAWTTRVTTASAPGTPLAWQRLDGLVYTCEDSAWLIRGRALAPLWVDNIGQPVLSSSLSEDGRYVATLRFSNVNAMGHLRVLEVDTGRIEVLGQARFIALLGWSADGRLYYLKSDTLTLGQRGLRLLRYDPATAASQPVIPNAIRPLGLAANGANAANWSPDRTALVLTANVAPYGAEAQWQAVRVPVTATAAGGWAAIEPLAGDSYAPILAPSGQQAAYGRQRADGPALELHDLAAHTRTRLVHAAELAEGGTLPDRLFPMEWSPDGGQLLFMATGVDYGDYLYSVGSDGQNLRRLAGLDEAGWTSPLGFSADGRYLAYFEASLSDPDAQLRVVDTVSGQAQDYPVFPGSVSWSPEGHLLALAVEEGAFVLDPATGQRRWLAFQTCQRVSWS